MSLAKNDSVRLRIDSLSGDGSGVARHAGQAVFVPHAAPGDVVEARVVKAAASHAFARITEIISPGPGRVESDCPQSSLCGGCCFRHISYGEELRAKRQFVADALSRIGGFALRPLPAIASPAQNRWRNKVQYPVAPGRGGAPEYGFYTPRSHRVVPCEDCLLQPRQLNLMAKKAAELLGSLGARAYDERANTGLVRHIYLREGAHTGEVLLCLVLRGFALPHKHLFAREMVAAFPEICTVVLNRNARDTNVICGPDSEVLLGGGSVLSRLGGVPAALGVHTFSQVNTEGAELLYAEVRRLAGPLAGKKLLDMYCGTGVIGLSMAGECARLVGVDAVPQAVQSARRSAAELGAANARFLCADAAQAAEKLCAEGFAPDVAVLDPPRKGADAQTLAALLRMAPARIVMVSCNPATLARDLAALARGGYTLTCAQPVDMFPRTRHVECVALLEK